MGSPKSCTALNRHRQRPDFPAKESNNYQRPKNQNRNGRLHSTIGNSVGAISTQCGKFQTRRKRQKRDLEQSNYPNRKRTSKTTTTKFIYIHFLVVEFRHLILH